MRLFRSTTFRLTAVLVLAFAAGYGSVIALRGREMALPELLSPPQERILMSMSGFSVSQFERGGVVWRASAAEADLFENRRARMKALEIVHAASRGEVVLRGEEGVLDTASGDAQIRARQGDVRVLSSDGYLLTTSSLTWTAQTRTVTTPDPFRLLGPKIYLEGTGVTASVERNTVVVESDVKAVLDE